ncbi:hypothetical protein HanPSC8_Chr11g0497971 [Helianthus annuus]|nr:hypothetical protein HanPSC8_Chr11g0497971 [Helianthus annuus]
MDPSQVMLNCDGLFDCNVGVTKKIIIDTDPGIGIMSRRNQARKANGSRSGKKTDTSTNA